MAWHRSGDKPLSEPMLTQFTWRIYGALGEDEFIPISQHTITWPNADYC